MSYDTRALKFPSNQECGEVGPKVDGGTVNDLIFAITDLMLL